MDLSIRAAAEALDADTLIQNVQAPIQFIEQSQFQLVETIERCRHRVDEFPVSRLRLRLSKPGAVRGSSAVGVIIGAAAATS
jgi:dihydroneopterin aldolase